MHLSVLIISYLCGLMDFYFMQRVIIHFYHYLFWCLNCPESGQWEPLQAASVSFRHFPIIPQAFAYFQTHHVLALGSANFTKKPLFSLAENTLEVRIPPTRSMLIFKNPSPLTPVQYLKVHSCLPIAVFVIQFSNSQKPGPMIFIIFTHLLEPRTHRK